MPSCGKSELKSLSSVISRPIRIGVYESIDSIVVDDDKATLRLITYDVRETSREIRFVARGVRLMGWTRTKSGPWDFGGMVTLWEDDYSPVIIVKWGRIVTPNEALQQLRWERDCHRPGSGRMPLDNFDRVLDGGNFGNEDNATYNTHKMERHWA